MAMVRKKQDDKYLEALRELITTGGGNRQCFDCGQKGPTYVNMTIGSFVCTRCSGVLRGITPPHRVKSISMATFTQDEIDFLKAHGNDVCAKTWLGLWDPKRAVHQDQRELMIDKYERKRYYLEPASPLKSLTNATNLKTTTSAAATAAATTTSSASVTASSANSTQNNTNNKTHIQLTPPTSQRTTANGLHKTSSSAISRPQHTTPPQSQNGFSSSLSNHTTDAFGLHNGLNSSIGSMSTGALSDTSSCASANGFGAEADFVADFGSADIFNATVASSPASSVGSSVTNNGYAKIQPMKISSAAHQQFMNGHGSGGGGGPNNVTTNLQNGNLTNGNTENFADFDHAPIYNAAEEPPNYQFVRKNAIRKKSTSSISGSIIRRNERQLKDILEMDNNENPVDYINFNEDDVFGETTATTTTKKNTTKSGGYSNLLDDFDALLTLDTDNSTTQQQTNFKEFESDYANIGVGGGVGGGGEHLANGSKFTPLALAAHATAMAVLGNQSHFNSQLQTAEVPLHPASKPPFTNQWDVWSTAKDMTKSTRSSMVATTTTPWFPNSNLIQQTYEVPPTQQLQQQQQQYLYASIANFNSGNLHTNQQQLQQQQQYPLPLQQQQQQQYFPSSTFSTSQTLTQSSATKLVATSATTIPTSSIITATTTTTTPTSMLNKNSINSTNPFRMHLDVNDNYNIINYDNNNYLNNYNNNTTNITPTTTTTSTTTTNINTDFNTNFNDFNFVSNSILSYNFDLFSTATTSLNSSSSSITTMTSTTTTPLQNDHNNYHNQQNNNNFNNNYNQNFQIYNQDDHDDHDNNDNDVKIPKNSKNPFLTSQLNNTNLPSDLSNPQQFSIYQSSNSSNTNFNSNSTFSTSVSSQKNPFYTPAPSDPTIRTFRHSVVVDDDDNNDVNVNNDNAITNNIQNNNNNNYYYASHGAKDVAKSENSCPSTNHNHNNYFQTNLNSNCNFNSYSLNTNTNLNANQNPNNYQNENNNNNNSWRLPINNNNNKNSTTNGFNNNMNNNSNHINNNNNSSAPAEDRYAALKDLDEQLRESKAVAAQAASIVTANVVDSGFGNPNVNVNGTVNPFATHHTHQQHHQQQTAVVNPFQNISNNPTQNTTQQLFGQMTLIPNGIAAANGFLNAQKTHTANTGFFNYTASGFTNANTPQIQQQQQHQQQQQQHQASILYPTSIQTGPNGCGFGFGTLQQQIASTGTGLTTNTFNNPFAATGALNSNNPFL